MPWLSSQVISPRSLQSTQPSFFHLTNPLASSTRPLFCSPAPRLWSLTIVLIRWTTSMILLIQLDIIIKRASLRGFLLQSLGKATRPSRRSSSSCLLMRSRASCRIAECSSSLKEGRLCSSIAHVARNRTTISQTIFGNYTYMNSQELSTASDARPKEAGLTSRRSLQEISPCWTLTQTSQSTIRPSSSKLRMPLLTWVPVWSAIWTSSLLWDSKTPMRI